MKLLRDLRFALHHRPVREPAAIGQVLVDEAIEDHRRATEKAAHVIAESKLAESRLRRIEEQLERLRGNVRIGLAQQQDANDRGDPDRAQEYASAVTTIRTQIVATETERATLLAASREVVARADAAKARVRGESSRIQSMLARQQSLRSATETLRLLGRSELEAGTTTDEEAAALVRRARRRYQRDEAGSRP